MSNIFGTHDENTIQQFRDVESRTVRAALMADAHFGYVMPVGGVAAYDNQVSVVGVGFDIACGNCAIKTNILLADIIPGLTARGIDDNPYQIIKNRELNRIADELSRQISFGIGRSNDADDAPVDDPLFIDHAWNIIPNIGRYRDDLRDKARRQLGTVGSGNHYVDVFVERGDHPYLWIGVHFGSRGLGHTIASNYLAIGQGGMWGDKGKEVETLLDLSTTHGHEYWELMELAGKYAYAGREWTARKALEIIGGKELDLVHNHHNFAWKEKHDGQELVVVRKGATPAFPGQRGFVGGSMGDDAVILEGTNPIYAATAPGNFGQKARQIHDEIVANQKMALHSTVHGAGRVMSRTAAKGKRDRKSGQLKRNSITGEIINAGLITPVMMDEWLNKAGVVLRGGDLDESPQAYRRLPEVLTSQGNTITVLNKLKPLIVLMAPKGVTDPYKD